MARQFLLTLVLVACVAAPAAAQTETVEYYGLDALGSVRMIFDQAGQPIERMDYGPFGENLKSAIKMSFEQFAQLARDGESGQDYAQAREFSPGTGRFNSPDPIYAGALDPQQWNRYAYALNNPVGFVDPNGLMAQGIRKCTYSETQVSFQIIASLSCTEYLFNWEPSGSGGTGRSWGAEQDDQISHGRPRRSGGTGPGTSGQPGTGGGEGGGNTVESGGGTGAEGEGNSNAQCSVPLAPAGVSIQRNLVVASMAKVSHADNLGQWFYNQVRNAQGRTEDVVNGASWDYKQLGKQYEAFGNFNYGAVAQRIGLPRVFALQGSFAAHVRSNGISAFGPTALSNEFGDWKNILRGWNYAKNGCK